MRVTLAAVTLSMLAVSEVRAEVWCAVPDTVSYIIESRIDDCRPDFTDPDPYVPGESTPLFRIPVVFHIVLRDTLGTGDVPNDSLSAQIVRLNQDYLAMTGTLGSGGYDTRIMFSIAAFDSGGVPSSGITRTVNAEWFDGMDLRSRDDSVACRVLRWDPAKFLNFYRTGTEADWGYAEYPWDVAGTYLDGIRVAEGFVGGAVSNGGAHGRVAVHEVGHFLGLYHDFQNYCDISCDSGGDFVCDTAPEAAIYGCNESYTVPCPAPSGTPRSDPFNYMSYHNDGCRTYFTAGQSGRMRCIMQSYRPTLYDSIVATITSNSGTDSVRVMCPAGGLKKYIVTVDFADAGMHHDIAARELTLTYDFTSAKLWPATLGDSLVADSSATAANGYRTTITVAHASGCVLGDSVVVRLDGISIGKAYININSPDFLPASPGTVDAGDLAAFAGELGCPGGCPAGHTYSRCFDLDPPGSDGFVDASDLTLFAYHYGSTHSRPGYPYKALSSGGEVLLSQLTQTAGVMSAALSVRSAHAASACGIVLAVNPGTLGRAVWRQDPGLTRGVSTYAVPCDDGESQRLVVFAVGAATLDGDQGLRLGTIEWQTKRDADVGRDVTLTYADLALANGEVVGLNRAGKPGELLPVASLANRLEQPEPNPFNPTTAVRYTIAERARVLLAIYDVGGHRVRTLVDAPQTPDGYEVSWDGKDQRGQALPTGIYLARLVVGGFSQTQKLVMVR